MLDSAFLPVLTGPEVLNAHGLKGRTSSLRLWLVGGLVLGAHSSIASGFDLVGFRFRV